MRILLVSPFPDSRDMYPHLRAFYEEGKKRSPVSYFYFPERGYEWHDMAKHLRNPFRKDFYKTLLRILRLFKGMFRLLAYWRQYDTFICIDNFLYSLCAAFFPSKRIILWSHDFISYDQERREYLFQKNIARRTAVTLLKHQELIIQDDARQRLLLASLPMMPSDLQVRVMRLPVSLPSVAMRNRRRSPHPVLMQTGGISRYTNSLALLEAYQKDSCSFDLFFHGFISDDVINRVDECRNIPILSSVTLGAGTLPKIIARADIGFLYYNGKSDLNYYNIRNASGQLVEFLRLDKPIIAMGHNNLRDLIEESGIGIYLENMDALDDAVAEITNDYLGYAERCRTLFRNHYDLFPYIDAFSDWLDRSDNAVDGKAGKALHAV